MSKKKVVKQNPAKSTAEVIVALEVEFDEIAGRVERLNNALNDESTTPEKMVGVVNEIAAVLKNLMAFPPENLDPIPSEAKQRPAEQQSYLARQLVKWY